MSTTSSVDFGSTVEDYMRYRAGMPEEVWRRLETLAWLGAPGHAVDLGCGTGDIARGLARRGWTVTGVDPSAPMMAGGAHLAAQEGVAERITWRQAAAEDTTLESARFDLVTAALCWHWFDPAAATREIRRLLRPGGRLIILHLGWARRPGAPTVTTLDTLHRHARVEAWAPLQDDGATNLYPAWLGHLTDGGLEQVESFSMDLDVSYTHAAWRGRIRASAAVGASLPPHGVEAFDQHHAADLAARHPDPMQVPHRAFVVSGVAR